MVVPLERDLLEVELVGGELVSLSIAEFLGQLKHCHCQSCEMSKVRTFCATTF